MIHCVTSLDSGDSYLETICVVDKFEMLMTLKRNKNEKKWRTKLFCHQHFELSWSQSYQCNVFTCISVVKDDSDTKTQHKDTWKNKFDFLTLTSRSFRWAFRKEISWESENKRQLNSQESSGFKGSSDPSPYIFEINVGKSRIRHTTTLNDEFLNRLKIDWRWRSNSESVLSRIRLFPTLISKIKWLWSELPLNQITYMI